MTNKITIEQFNNCKIYTVIYSDTFYTEQSAKDWSGFIGIDLDNGTICGYCKAGELYWIALPPLPRNPTADDAKLLYAYAAQGLRVVFEQRLICSIDVGIFIGVNHKDIMCQKEKGGYCDYYYFRRAKALHALNEAGERVEIAIYDGEVV